jgi:phosphate transport system substrate-binding protein
MYFMPSAATVNDQTYPIARDLYMYTADEPTGAVKAYLEWILGAEAKRVVGRLGFVPIETGAQP